MPDPTTIPSAPSDEERYAVLHQLEDWLEGPMMVLGFVWLALLVVEMVWGLGPVLETATTVIWVVFIADFVLRLALAPSKRAYLRRNWLTAISLVVPALRVFRALRAVQALRLARAARGARLVKVVASLNRGMRSLRRTLRRRGAAYVGLLTLLVAFAGAAGMYALEQGAAGGGFASYGEALWWTAMLMTTMGSQYWPVTPEGRTLCLFLSLYAFGVFGYLTATIASFFVGRDVAEETEAAPDVAGGVEALREEIVALRGEIRGLRVAGGASGGD